MTYHDVHDGHACYAGVVVGRAYNRHGPWGEERVMARFTSCTAGRPHHRVDLACDGGGRRIVHKSRHSGEGTVLALIIGISCQMCWV